MSSNNAQFSPRLSLGQFTVGVTATLINLWPPGNAAIVQDLSGNGNTNAAGDPGVAQPSTVRINNQSAQPVFLKIGSSTVVADTSSLSVSQGQQSYTFNPRSQYLSLVTGAATATVNVTVGDGWPG